MEELLFFALLGTQIVLILILIVIALLCRNTLVGIRNGLKSMRNSLASDGHVATELRGIHQQLRDIEYHTRKPPAPIEDLGKMGES